MQYVTDLYGYSHNYSILTNGIVYIFEAEKSVMQCYTYGIRNCVALGSGTISKKQCQMILELNPKKVIFMHDAGFELESIEQKYYAVKNVFEILGNGSRILELL